ncbi:hypothetical protein [Streptomyces jumonjinensis]|uniref:hypothetical protein n=1 Tax=Streptomyces jumonjinensis TaxID=1945 RepID=UPI00378CC724
MTTFRALTIRQPWAAAITYADKRVENRTWPSKHRGPLLIHAGQSMDRSVGTAVRAVVRGLQLDRGAVVAVARLTDCHPDDGQCSPWSMSGCFHHVLDRVTPLHLPVPYQRGALGLWVPPQELLDQVLQQLDHDTVAQLLDPGTEPQ